MQMFIYFLLNRFKKENEAYYRQLSTRAYLFARHSLLLEIGYRRSEESCHVSSI